MSEITFNGLASGLDTASIISALVQVAKQPITQLESKKTSINTKLSVLSDLSSRLGSLRTAALALDTSKEVRSFAASSSDTTTLTAAATSSAAPGTYPVVVQRLAAAQRSYSNTVASSDGLNQVGSGTLGIQVGSGTWKTITIDQSTQTLQGVATAINGANAGVTASVVKYSDNQYRLLINGTQLGAAGAVSFSETGTLATTLGLSTSTPAQAAVDAWIQIDGNDIYRASNQISDALPGTTLNLVKPSATPVTLTIAADPDAIAAKVQTMVSAYNSAMALIKKQNTYSGEAKTDSLIGDSTLLEIKRRLQSIISGQVSAVTGDYKALSRVGISTNRDGSLTLDTSALKKAITTDLDSVTALFSYSDNNSSTDNDGVAVRLISALDDILRSSTGLLAARQSGLTDTVESIDTRVAALQRSVDTYEAGLKKQFTALETLLSSLQSQGSQLKIS